MPIDENTLAPSQWLVMRWVLEFRCHIDSQHEQKVPFVRVRSLEAVLLKRSRMSMRDGDRWCETPPPGNRTAHVPFTACWEWMCSLKEHQRCRRGCLSALKNKVTYSLAMKRQVGVCLHAGKQPVPAAGERDYGPVMDHNHGQDVACGWFFPPAERHWKVPISGAHA